MTLCMNYKNATVRKSWCFRKNYVNKVSASKECELCLYWFFKDVRFKFEEHIYIGCHGLLRMAYGLENIAILSAKRATFRCILLGISRNEGLKRLNNSVLENKGAS